MNTRPRLTFLLLVLLVYLPQDGIHAQGPTANLSTTWTYSSSQDINLYNRTFYSYFLIRWTSPRPYWPSSNLSGPPHKHYFPFAFGWYVCKDCEGYVLSIYILHFLSMSTNADDRDPQVIWSANRNKPVKENSTVELTRDGDLLLKDSDGSPVWSTQTAGGKSAVVGLNLTHNGNLILHDADGAIVWQSFDHPTESLVSGQSIMEGQRLTANASPSKFTAGYIVFLGDSSISWKTKKQSSVAKSTTEAEFKAMADYTSEIIWLHDLYKDLGYALDKPTYLYCDNKAAIHIAENPVFHERTKHINIACHFIREQMQRHLITATFTPTSSQLADLFTKPLAKSRFWDLLSKLKIEDIHSSA